MDTIEGLLKIQPGNQTLGGTYRLTIECRNPFGASFNQFLGTMSFASPAGFVARPPKTYPPIPGAPAGSGAAGQAGGPAGAGSGGSASTPGSRWPNAPNAAPGAPTGSVNDVFSGGGIGGVPLPIIVVGLLALVGGVSWWTHRGAPGGTVGSAAVRMSMPPGGPAEDGAAVDVAAAGVAGEADAGRTSGASADGRQATAEDDDLTDGGDGGGDTAGSEADGDTSPAHPWPTLPLNR